jgi:hypothetical protein
MGGDQSKGSRHLVEDCLVLSVDRLGQAGVLQADSSQAGTWQWDAADGGVIAALAYEAMTTAAGGWLRLTYSIREPEISADYRVGLTTTRPRFGGLRWWFLCPLGVNGVPCGRRVGKLYLPPAAGYYGCRHCHDLTYASCREDRRFDTVLRAVAGAIGCSPTEAQLTLLDPPGPYIP